MSVSVWYGYTMSSDKELVERGREAARRARERSLDSRALTEAQKRAEKVDQIFRSVERKR